MSAPAGTRRLIYLRNELFRYIKQSAQPKYGPGFYTKQYSSCSTEKEKAVFMTVTNPGTSFVRIVPEKPVFANFPKFPKPCSEGEE